MGEEEFLYNVKKKTFFETIHQLFLFLENTFLVCFLKLFFSFTLYFYFSCKVGHDGVILSIKIKGELPLTLEIRGLLIAVINQKETVHFQ